MQGLARNIELKARYENLGECRRLAEAAGAKFAGRLEQIDTYFHVAHGRLKLRRINGTEAELIWYERPDAADFRDSRYYRVATDDPDGLAAALTAACGVRGEVPKSRDLLLLDNIRIHLDQVRGLGNFIEFEAVIGNHDIATSQRRLDELHRALGVDPRLHCTSSYVDLLNI
jgi:adenylate cyclase class 2